MGLFPLRCEGRSGLGGVEGRRVRWNEVLFNVHRVSRYNESRISQGSPCPCPVHELAKSRERDFFFMLFFHHMR